MHLVHLTASTFFGGPERQMLGLAEHLPPPHTCGFLSFAEGGRAEEFTSEVRRQGFPADVLSADTPNVRAAVRVLVEQLFAQKATVLLTHSYKPNILGRIAARRLGIPVVAVSRGWTGENRKVRVYEWLDRYNLRLMDHVVAVSSGQANKVLAAGVRGNNLSVIPNAARINAFTTRKPEYAAKLRAFFPKPVEFVIIAAGRHSPEKGFDVLIDAIAKLPRELSIGVVQFGDGVDRQALQAKIVAHNLHERFILAGFTPELDHYLPWADLLVLPSYTEGLPNVVLEASAAGVPVVATAVGGTPEAVVSGETGILVPPGDPIALARAIAQLERDPMLRAEYGRAGRERMHARFTFPVQAEQYLELFNRMKIETPTPKNRRRGTSSPASVQLPC